MFSSSPDVYDLVMPSLKIRKHGTGFLVRYGKVRLALDTGINDTTTLLSHAHADHIGDLEKAKQIISTEATFDTLLARGGKIQQSIQNIEYEEAFGQLGVFITAKNAGHVLGSAMFKLDFDDGPTILYTGDFNVIDSVVHSGAKPLQADVLMTEATYGTPRWIFPDRKSIHLDIVNICLDRIEDGRVPILRAYSLGKAQEAIALLQREGIEVISGNAAIDAISEVYNNHGKNLEYISLEDKKARTALQRGCAIVTSAPRHTLSNIRKKIGDLFAKDLERRKENYNLSGWTLGEYKNGGFPLSAHTDFPNLLEFAEKVNPKIAYCFTSNAEILAQYLTQKGISAVPLE